LAELAVPLVGSPSAVGHAERNDPNYVVAACRFCNEASNRTKWDVAGKSPDELVAQKKPIVLAVREQYRAFWLAEVQSRDV